MGSNSDGDDRSTQPSSTHVPPDKSNNLPPKEATHKPPGDASDAVSPRLLPSSAFSSLLGWSSQQDRASSPAWLKPGLAMEVSSGPIASQLTPSHGADKVVPPSSPSRQHIEQLSTAGISSPGGSEWEEAGLMAASCLVRPEYIIVDICDPPNRSLTSLPLTSRPSLDPTGEAVHVPPGVEGAS